MRYTLRLLTLDQLGRAAALICALELERQQDVEKLGEWPFEIGLWVGMAAMPWTGEVGAFFGRVDRVDSQGFYGPCNPTAGRPLPVDRLPPPDLVIQDELHL